MRDLVQFIAEALVDEPDQVRVESEDGRVQLLLAPDDLGRVIGRRGRTAKAIRTVMRAAAGRGRAPELKIEECAESAGE